MSYQNLFQSINSLDSNNKFVVEPGTRLRVVFNNFKIASMTLEDPDAREFIAKCGQHVIECMTIIAQEAVNTKKELSQCEDRIDFLSQECDSLNRHIDMLEHHIEYNVADQRLETSRL